MKYYIYSLFTLFLFFNCTENKPIAKALSFQELAETAVYKEASVEKKQLFSEIKTFQKDLESKQVHKIPDYLDCPKIGRAHV